MVLFMTVVVFLLAFINNLIDRFFKLYSNNASLLNTSQAIGQVYNDKLRYRHCSDDSSILYTTAGYCSTTEL